MEQTITVIKFLKQNTKNNLNILKMLMKHFKCFKENRKREYHSVQFHSITSVKYHFLHQVWLHDVFCMGRVRGACLKQAPGFLLNYIVSPSSSRSFLLTDDVTSLLSEVSIHTRICIQGPYFHILQFVNGNIIMFLLFFCSSISLKTNLPILGILVSALSQIHHAMLLRCL